MKVRHFLAGILIGIPIGITFLDTVGYIAKVEGVSMQPTLNPDERHPDYVFLNRRAVRTQDIQRGEIDYLEILCERMDTKKQPFCRYQMVIAG
ncbi:mitochondrial inner membrane protease subunit 2 isoform X2 [Ceratina calcarata]|uniref:Mitochondrial inner membrane protease subunit 2 isoform X2 n=1 Tax=Ceratina calcarata TaxID=156304 RepID=A0AAJ7JC49_9HYME|nr:mitochondrial inner membrane protease subunit 2 isoform X2 [Ceratina calcarata]